MRQNEGHSKMPIVQCETILLYNAAKMLVGYSAAVIFSPQEVIGYSEKRSDLQSLTKELGCDALLSEKTYAAVTSAAAGVTEADRCDLEMEPLSSVAIRGKREPVTIYGLGTDRQAIGNR